MGYGLWATTMAHGLLANPSLGPLYEDVWERRLTHAHSRSPKSELLLER